MKADEKGMKRVCFYLRNSTSAGQQDYIFQREALMNALNHRINIANNVILVSEYAEQISGTKEHIKDRPELYKMLNNLETFDEIWCYDIKRLARNAIVLLTVVRDCTNAGVNIFFMQDAMSTLNGDGTENKTAKYLLGLLGELAADDRNAFIQKGIDGKQTATRQGNYTGGNLPCGYTYINAGVKLKSSPKKIVIDDSKRKVVEYIFDQIANKKQTCNSTAINLNNLKLIDSDFETVMKSKNYGERNNKWMFHSWAGSTIKKIINCTWYVKGQGYRIYNGEKIELDDSLTFIDADLWTRANEQLKSNQFVKTKTKHTYLIKDLLYCECGEKMYPQNSSVRWHYKCKLNIQNDRDKSIFCNAAKTVGVEQLENNLFLLIKNKLPEFKLTVQKKENKVEQIKEKIQENNNIIEVINSTNLKNLDARKKRIIHVYETIGGDSDEFQNKINAVDFEIKNEKTKINSLESENKLLTISMSELDIATELENNILAIQNDTNLIKYYFEKLIKKVTVCGVEKKQLNNVIKIDWNENVNNNNSTFLFYHSKVKQRPLYYFIYGGNENIEINWNTKTKTFNILDKETNKIYEQTFDQLTETLNRLYYENIEINIPEFKYTNYHLILEPQFNQSDNNINILTIVDRFNSFDMDFIPRFPINAGVAVQEILFKFK